MWQLWKLISEKNRLTNALQKFTKGSETLDIILENQKAFRDKTSLGYDQVSTNLKATKSASKGKSYMKIFKKYFENVSPFWHYNYCNKKSHTQSICLHRRHDIGQNYKWVPKGKSLTKEGKTPTANRVNRRPLETANPKGPKNNWVPKSV